MESVQENCNHSTSHSIEHRIALEEIFLADIAKFERFSYPTWLIIGVPGSILTIIIWSRKSMRRNGSFSAATYQAALAVVDLCFLSCYMLYYLHLNKIQVVLDTPLCRIYPLIAYTFQYVTPLLNLSIILERYIAVKYPFNKKHFCGRSKRSAIRILILCAGIAFTFSCSLAFYFQNDEKSGKCYHSLEYDSNHYIFYWIVIVEVIFFGVIPLICLIFNILLAVILRNLSKNQLQPVVQTNEAKPPKSTNVSSTITLVCVSFYLIFAHFSVAISLIFAYSLEEGKSCLSESKVKDDPTWLKYFMGFRVKSILESVCFSHSALKFFVYLATSKMFRHEFLIVIHCCKSDQDKALASLNTRKSLNKHKLSNDDNRLFMRSLKPKSTSTTPITPRKSRQMSKTVFNEYGERVLVT